MEYRRLGSSGLKLSALSLGSWITFTRQLDEDQAYECMKLAFDSGVNFFDSAEAYGAGKAEAVMGRALKKAGWKRSDLVISTKLYWGGSGPNDEGLSRKHILEGIDASLDRLQLSYVDLLFCHRPDRNTPVEETVRAMNHVIAQGKALYWGTSEWTAGEIMEAYSIARREHLIPAQMEQPEYNLFERRRVEQEYARLYSRIGLGLTTFSPLAGGRLTGKYDRGMPVGTRASLPGFDWLARDLQSDQVQADIARAKDLAQVAADLGCTRPQLALAWCLKNPNVSTVITGASRPEQLKENLGALEVVGQLTEAVMARIEAILQNAPGDDLRD
jgi:voltage-dependent potassium channel beta subunit